MISEECELTKAKLLHSFGLEVLNVSSLGPSKPAAQDMKGAACAKSQDTIVNVGLATVRNFLVL